MSLAAFIHQIQLTGESYNPNWDYLKKIKHQLPEFTEHLRDVKMVTIFKLYSVL